MALPKETHQKNGGDMLFPLPSKKKDPVCDCHYQLFTNDDMQSYEIRKTFPLYLYDLREKTA